MPARSVSEPPGGPAPIDDRIARFRARALHRSGVATLGEHLSAHYGTDITAVEQLDIGAYRADRADGSSWMVRMFPAGRQLADVRGDAEILTELDRAGFPAERPATDDPVSSHEGQAVLVTEFVPGRRARGNGDTFRALGDLLGRLHTMDAPAPGSVLARPGGAWHHMAFRGGPADEVAAAAELWEAARPSINAREERLYDHVHRELLEAERFEGLPNALVHPDFVPANAIATPTADLVLVDWACAGQGPRIWPLAFLLWAGGGRDLRLVDAAVARYRTYVTPTPDELDRLGVAVRARPLVFAAWGYCAGRRTLAQVVDDLNDADDLADPIADRARQAFARAR